MDSRLRFHIDQSNFLIFIIGRSFEMLFNRTSVHPFILCASLIWLLAPVATAFAGEANGPNARARADDICSGYGPGFVAGAMPGHCVKVEERLRVERNVRRDLAPWDTPSTFAPLGPNDGAMPAHLRLNGGFGAGQRRGVR